ncbi:BAR-domain-containing protein [Pterulicium gracile]|uniref:BAR-domain-containing protein n=1 Tax=Pterulicium gracile TaxID=1884261 RepID=A0A5C3R0D7_9AGAR|nr:BAR-domain-containing protein [Pterula gracilis]
MKGFTKAMKRTPHMMTSRVGLSKKSNDPEFDDYHRAFVALEQGTEKLLKDTKLFTESITSLFTSSQGFATHFSTIFHPISGEYDLIGNHPDAGHTIRNVEKYETAMEELRAVIAPELELIESRIVAPVQEYQTVLKTVRKTITKRDHKLTDYDRHNNSLMKLRDKKEKTLSDEKNLFKLEQDFELATNEYDYINSALKNDMPRFLTLTTQFIDPLFHSFYYMQLNVYYLMLEKIHSFGDESKYDVASAPGGQIQADYEEKRTDAWSQIEELGVVKRIVSLGRLVQAKKAEGSIGGGSTLGRSSSMATTTSAYSSNGPPPSRTSTFSKKAPPPPPGASSSAAPPPPYTPGNSSAAAAAVATKRAPPPPPAKMKPKMEPPKEYVVALYDFDAQAEGDLSFRAGERIEIVQKSQNTEDWWTGRVNGQEGVFPGNYVQET